MEIAVQRIRDFCERHSRKDEQVTQGKAAAAEDESKH
jgi:hypothetical protein